MDYAEIGSVDILLPVRSQAIILTNAFGYLYQYSQVPL